MNSRFLKKSIIYFIGNFSSKIMSVLLIPIYASFVSTEDLGNYDYIIALMNIIIPIVFFNMWDSILKFGINRNKKEELEKIYTSAIVFVAINIVLFIIGYLIIHRFNIISYPCFNLSIIMMLSYGFISLWQYACRAFQKNSVYALSGVISSFVNIILIIIFIIILDLGLIGLVLSYIVSMLTAIIFIEKKIGIIHYINFARFDVKLLKKMCLFSAPIVLNTVSLWGMSGISKIICVNFLDSSSNGLFSFGSKFGSLITIFGSILGAVIIEEAYLVKDLKEYKNTFSKLINKIFLLYLIVLYIGIPTINVVFDILWVDNAYYQSRTIIPLITLGSVFSCISTNLGSSFQVTDKTIFVFITSLLGSLCSVILSFILVEKFEIIGLAIGQLVGSLTLMITRAIFAYKLTGLTVKWGRTFIRIILFAFISILSFKLNVVYNLLFILVIILVLFFLFKDEIMSMLKSGLKRRKF